MMNKGCVQMEIRTMTTNAVPLQGSFLRGGDSLLLRCRAPLTSYASMTATVALSANVANECIL
jgi:hypothetical protein